MSSVFDVLTIVSASGGREPARHRDVIVLRTRFEPDTVARADARISKLFAYHARGLLSDGDLYAELCHEYMRLDDELGYPVNPRAAAQCAEERMTWGPLPEEY